MTLVVGFLMLALGLVALVVWLPQLWPFFQGMTVLSLLFWGALCLVLGLSQRKARREFERSISDSPSPFEGEKISEDKEDKEEKSRDAT